MSRDEGKYWLALMRSSVTDGSDECAKQGRGLNELPVIVQSSSVKEGQFSSTKGTMERASVPFAFNVIFSYVPLAIQVHSSSLFRLALNCWEY